jgi:hypothetical protein
LEHGRDPDDAGPSPVRRLLGLVARGFGEALGGFVVFLLIGAVAVAAVAYALGVSFKVALGLCGLVLVVALGLAAAVM